MMDMKSETPAEPTEESMLYTHFLKSYIHAQTSQRGATMVEYGVMVALIAAISIAIVGVLGRDVLDAFTKTSAGMP